MIVAPPSIAEVAAGLGLTVLSWELPKRIDGLYFFCPARRLRLLLVGRLLGAAARERVLTRAVVWQALGGDTPTARLLLEGE